MAEFPNPKYQMIDNATAQQPLLSDELSEIRTSARNPALNRETRLDAFGDIIASEVGDTLLTRARNIEKEVGLRQIYIKFEGGNPTGTQKDRIAFGQVEDALRRGYDSICFATCGNYGVALSFAASLAGLNCRIYIPRNYNSLREKEMSSLGATILREGRDYEESVDISGKYALENDLYDANPGGQNTAIQLKAYGEIAFEIYDELRDAPAVVAVPVSNGTTLAGIHRGFQQLYRRGKTSRIPRIIAGSSSNKNPIISSFKKGLPTCEDLPPEQIKESMINEPLINWHSIDGDMALDAIYTSSGYAGDGNDRRMAYYSSFLKKNEGLSVLPASTAGLIALTEYHTRESLPGDRYVVVLTGRK